MSPSPIPSIASRSILLSRSGEGIHFGYVARRRFVLFNWPLVEIINCSKILATRDTLQLAAAMLSGISRRSVEESPAEDRYPPSSLYSSREHPWIPFSVDRGKACTLFFLPLSLSLLLSLPRHEQLISPVEAGTAFPEIELRYL